MKRRYNLTKRKWPSNSDLAELSDEQLFELRLCDLKVRIQGTKLESRIEQVYEELAARGLHFRPHFWLSDDWFSPDGVPGVAIPFYLAHPRLIRLERKQMIEVEGSNHDWCMKILRHEVGHAIDTAFRLRRRRCFREVFGPVSQPYPKYYQPKPYSRSYVLHLENWYAQAHPVEDFAETFAVWLKPRSRWRSQYRGWPALQKLEFVDELMRDLQHEKPVVTSREHVEPISQIRRTVRDYYRQKRSHYQMDCPNVYDGDLRKLFSDSPAHRSNLTAAAFLRGIRAEVRQAVARWTGEYQYTIDQVLSEMIVRCRELKLRLCTNEEQAKQDAIILVTMQTMNHLHGGYHRVAL